MPYNAMDDAMKMRIMRSRVDEFIKTAASTDLLMILIDLINPAYVRPLLIGLRDNLNGMTDEDLDNLIASLPH